MSLVRNLPLVIISVQVILDVNKPAGDEATASTIIDHPRSDVIAKVVLFFK